MASDLGNENDLETSEGFIPDEGTISMFGDEPSVQTSPKSPYLVLARKYRPQSFGKTFIGQDAMVRTLRNAFAQNRIAHGFMLTGVRGVGKTTTARLLARALNFSLPDNDNPSMDLEVLGTHCEAITQGRHPDVIELDAASNTGVDNMRELLDNARYRPISARYKIYIIDEVHMLSLSSFNALLKTLEEPPEHIKFIFATTETHKVPVTILSRCQRFDLRRVDKITLADYLENICGLEKMSVAREGLEQIARAAEGSVRDALSLLDQALVQKNEMGEISAEDIRNMLGLADRNRIYDLFGHVLSGDTKSAMIELKEQYDLGTDPTSIIGSLMELCHEIAKLLVMGDVYKEIEKGDRLERLKGFTGQTSQMALSRLWQMLLLGFEETRRAPDGLQAADICLLRLCAISSMPPPEELLRKLSDDSGPNENQKVQEAPKITSENSVSMHEVSTGNTFAANDKISINSFDEIIKLIELTGNRALVLDLERYVKPIRFEQNLFSFEAAKGAPKSLRLDLAATLEEMTGENWKIYLESGGGETIEQKRKNIHVQKENEIKELPQIKAFLKAFPGSKIVKITEENPQEAVYPNQIEQ